MSSTLGSAYYARTSTEEQREKQTIQSQVAALEAQIQKNGEPLVGRYVDDGCSGALLDRPALDRLRADAKQQVFRKLYLYSPDRLARELMLQLVIVKELRQQGVEVVFLSQKFGDSPADQLLFQMLGAISEFERAQILERTRRGKLYKARSGVLIGSIPKFGYTYIKKCETAAGRYEINPAEAAVAREIFRLFNSPAVWGLRSLAKELYRRGVKTRAGNSCWGKSSLVKILSDTTYIGTTYFNKHYSCEPRERTANGHSKGKSSRRLRPREEWIPIRVPAIVDRAEFDAAQTKLAKNREFGPRNVCYEYLLKGMVFCACGRRMYGYPCHGKPRYKCSDKYARHPLPKTCTRGTIGAATLDNAAWRAFLMVLDHPNVVAEKVHSVDVIVRQNHEEREKSLRSVEQGLAALKEQEDRLLAAYSTKVIDLTQLKAQLTALKQKEQKLAGEQRQLQAEPQTPSFTDVELTAYFGMLKTKASNASFELRQQIMRLFANRVVVDGTRVEVAAVLPHPLPTELTTSARWGRNGDKDIAVEIGLPLDSLAGDSSTTLANLTFTIGLPPPRPQRPSPPALPAPQSPER